MKRQSSISLQPHLAAAVHCAIGGGAVVNHVGNAMWTTRIGITALVPEW